MSVNINDMRVWALRRQHSPTRDLAANILGLIDEIEARDRQIKELQQALEQAGGMANDNAAVLLQAEAQVKAAHSWFERQFGEQMNGRDIETKCTMADREIANWRSVRYQTAKECADLADSLSSIFTASQIRRQFGVAQ